MLHDLAIFLCAAVLCVPIATRSGFGAVLGYLLAGILIGPAGFGLITADESLLHFSEFGVVLLLFLIGLELQPRRLWRLRKTVFFMGGSQVFFTGLLIAAIALAFTGDGDRALVIGFGLAVSSTALVLQMFGERNELARRHARAGFGVLLFQDLAVIPMLVLIPVVASGGVAVTAVDAWLGGIKLVAVFVGFAVFGRFATRPILRVAASARAPEVFTSAALLMVIGSAMLMEFAGLSVSLGAFVAGVLLADSEYRHQIQADIEPFKGLLLGLFFMAVGMGVNLDVLVQQPSLVAGIAVGLLVVKFAVLVIVGRLSGLELRTSVLMAAALAQGGEFAFVLFGQASKVGLLPVDWVQLINLSVTLSMMATPLIYIAVTRWLEQPEEPAFDVLDGPENPVVIAGFGPFGQIIGRVLRLKGIGYTVLERDYRQVDFVRQYGNTVYYGDASRVELLAAAHAGKARALVVTITDPEDSLAVVETAKRHFPRLRIYAAAATRHHVLRLMDLGVRHIIRRSYFSSLEMTRELLNGLGLDSGEVDETLRVFREHDERTLQRQHALAHNEKAMIQTSQQAADELRQLFDADQRRGSGPGGDGPE